MATRSHDPAISPTHINLTTQPLAFSCKRLQNFSPLPFSHQHSFRKHSHQRNAMPLPTLPEEELVSFVVDKMTSRRRSISNSTAEKVEPPPATESVRRRLTKRQQAENEINARAVKQRQLWMGREVQSVNSELAELEGEGTLSLAPVNPAPAQAPASPASAASAAAPVASVAAPAAQQLVKRKPSTLWKKVEGVGESMLKKRKSFKQLGKQIVRYKDRVVAKASESMSQQIMVISPRSLASRMSSPGIGIASSTPETPTKKGSSGRQHPSPLNRFDGVKSIVVDGVVFELVHPKPSPLPVFVPVIPVSKALKASTMPWPVLHCPRAS